MNSCYQQLCLNKLCFVTYCQRNGVVIIELTIQGLISASLLSRWVYTHTVLYTIYNIYTSLFHLVFTFQQRQTRLTSIRVQTQVIPVASSAQTTNRRVKKWTAASSSSTTWVPTVSWCLWRRARPLRWWCDPGRSSGPASAQPPWFGPCGQMWNSYTQPSE